MRTMYATVIAASFWRSARAIFALGCFATCCLITLICPYTRSSGTRHQRIVDQCTKVEHSVLNATLTKNFAVKPNAPFRRVQELWSARNRCLALQLTFHNPDRMAADTHLGKLSGLNFKLLEDVAGAAHLVALLDDA